MKPTGRESWRFSSPNFSSSEAQLFSALSQSSMRYLSAVCLELPLAQGNFNCAFSLHTAKRVLLQSGIQSLRPLITGNHIANPLHSDSKQIGNLLIRVWLLYSFFFLMRENAFIRLT